MSWQTTLKIESGDNLDQVNIDVDFVKRMERPKDSFALHRKQSDFSIDRSTVDHRATQLLPIPDHIFDRKRNLLLDLEFNDIRESSDFDRWWFEETGQSCLSRYADRDFVSDHLISRKKLLQRVLDQLIRIGVVGAEDFGILNKVVFIGHHRLPVFVERTAQCFDRALSNINTPNGILFCHGLRLSVGIFQSD